MFSVRLSALLALETRSLLIDAMPARDVLDLLTRFGNFFKDVLTIKMRLRKKFIGSLGCHRLGSYIDADCRYQFVQSELRDREGRLVLFHSDPESLRGHKERMFISANEITET